MYGEKTINLISPSIVKTRKSSILNKTLKTSLESLENPLSSIHQENRISSSSTSSNFSNLSGISSIHLGTNPLGLPKAAEELFDLDLPPKMPLISVIKLFLF